MSYVERTAQRLEKQFNLKAEDFLWQMKEGGGIENIHILSTLRSLECLYLECAAYRQAANLMKEEEHETSV